MPHKDVRRRSHFYLGPTARCSNPQLGQLLSQYLNHALSKANRRRFHGHLLTCTCCSAAVYNAESMEEYERDRTKQRPAKRPVTRRAN
jgi:hypothetical protein